MADGNEALPEQMWFNFEMLVGMTKNICERYGVGSVLQHPPLHEDQNRRAS
jgi:hypothetical protein